MNAPGKPGIEPRWTTSAKSGVGTAHARDSRLWFSISHGIVNEVYFPRLDQANTRDMELLITGSGDFFAEEKRDCSHQVDWIAAGVPGFVLTNRCLQDRFQIKKTVLADPRRSALLQLVDFQALQSTLDQFRLFVLISPHVGNAGAGNDGWSGVYKGIPMLFAQRGPVSLALAANPGFLASSCGYVGYSDGWQQIREQHSLTEQYEEARDGNIALSAELNLQAQQGRVSIVLAFGTDPEEAALVARETLEPDPAVVQSRYVKGWSSWQSTLANLGDTEHRAACYRTSTAVLRTHQEKSIPGAWIASLSIPWGSSKGDNDLGGYHLVWVRDLVESAGGLLAAGDFDAAREAMLYLTATQETDGRWPQNMWLNGSPYWAGIQLDEVAFPILLADLLRREGQLDGLDPWPMVRAAASFLVLNGPVTQQDRWEEDGGYSPFTLAVIIAGLLAAADFADADEPLLARYLRETADAWNDSIETWTYVEGTDLARACGVSGYYVRIAPPPDGQSNGSGKLPRGDIRIRNLPTEGIFPEDQIVSPDVLALVRFGLRAADDPRIVNTVRVIDQVLKSETASGPVWHRYNHDGYGEHDDGSPFDGTGVGRGWPLLTGERAHYEFALGNLDSARQLCDTFASQSSPGGLIPEQIWEHPDIPDLELFNGKPSGSAMPLVWAHAEFVKLLRTLRDDKIFDMPTQPANRYRNGRSLQLRVIWRFDNLRDSAPAGAILRLEVLAQAGVRWTQNDWASFTDTPSINTGFGIHYIDLYLTRGTSQVEFTFYWPEAGRWEGTNFAVRIS